MSYNRKKLNNKKEKKQKDPNKFHLGRNLGTYLICLAGLIFIGFLVLVLFATLIGETSYLQVYNKNKVNPYQDDDHKELIVEPTYYEAKDYDLFDISLVAESVDTHDAHKIAFELKMVKNEATPDLVPLRYSTSGGFEAVATSSYRAYVSLCVAADWVGVCQYSSSYTYITQSKLDSTLENTSHTHINVTLKSEQVFPMKTNNWPVPVTIKTPDAYLLIAYMELVNGANVVKFDILHYTYDDYYEAGTTTPAI